MGQMIRNDTKEKQSGKHSQGNNPRDTIQKVNWIFRVQKRKIQETEFKKHNLGNNRENAIQENSDNQGNKQSTYHSEEGERWRTDFLIWSDRWE